MIDTVDCYTSRSFRALYTIIMWISNENELKKIIKV